MPLDNTLTQAATTHPNSYDSETRRVSAVIATATPVERRDARGKVLEVLTVDTLDLSNVVGLAVLDSHNTASVRHQLAPSMPSPSKVTTWWQKSKSRPPMTPRQSGSAWKTAP